MKITEDFIGNETKELTKTKIATILRWWGFNPDSYSTWGNARVDMNNILSGASSSTISDRERASSFLSKINYINDTDSVIGDMLFAANEPGVWYDPSDLSTLFQDAAGTTPVTAVEQPVGLMLDKSKGLGPELVTNGDFSNGTAGWSALGGTISSINGELILTDVEDAIGARAYQEISTVVGQRYEVRGLIVTGPANADIAVGVAVTGGAIAASTQGPGSKRFSFVAQTATTIIRLSAGAQVGATATLDNISVRELPGNHASQPTATSRPVLSARVNRAVSTEDFSLVGQWSASVAGTGSVPVRTANAGVSPVGTNTATRLQLALNGGTTISDYSGITQGTTQTGTWLVGSTVTSSVWVKTFDGSTQTIRFDANGLSGNTYQITGEWKKLSFDWTVDVANRAGFTLRLRGAQGTSDAVDILIWGADLRVANTGAGLPAYQRVNTATDYDTVGFPHYLRFDGVDDGMVTNSIDFSSTDKVTVVTGVRKLSDATLGMMLELSSDATVNNGSFSVRAPQSAGSPNYQFLSRGSSFAAPTPTGYVAPTTNVLSGAAQISADTAFIKINGTNVGTSTADQGTGNYGNYPLYIGRRGGTGFPFNGHIYGLVIVGKLLSDSQLISTEKYINGLTKAY